MFSSPLSSQCQTINSFAGNAFGQLKISDTTFFMNGKDPINYNLHMYKFTFSNTSPDWANKLVCPSGSWFISLSEAVLKSSKIYDFFTFGNPTQYLYLAVISSVSGTVSARYKSSISWPVAYGIAVNGDYIVTTAWNNYLIIYDTAAASFDIKLFSGDPYGWATELGTER